MKIQRITTGQGLQELKSKAKNVAHNVKEHVSQNADSYIAGGVGLAAIGGYAAVLKSALKSSSGENAGTADEMVKVLDANNYIERTGEQYNLVHIGYDGAGIMKTPIEPSQYAFYGLNPIENVNSVSESAVSDVINNSKDGVVKVLNGGDFIEKVGDHYNLVHHVGGDMGILRTMVDPSDYGITPGPAAELLNVSDGGLAEGIVNGIHAISESV